MSNSDGEDTLNVLQERKELMQDVIDRLLSNPEYKAALVELNNKFPALKDYNRRLDKSREEPEINNNNKPVITKQSSQINYYIIQPKNVNSKDKNKKQ